MHVETHGPAAPQKKLLLSLAVFGLALVEVHSFTLAFPAQRLLAVDEAWTRLPYQLPRLVPCGIAVVAGVILFARHRILEALRSFGGTLAPHWRPWALVHGMASVLLFLFTQQLFASANSLQEPPEFAAALWAVGVAVAGVSLVALVLPLRVCGALLRRRSPWFGAAAGVLAWAVGRFGQATIWESLGVPTLMAVRFLLQLILPSASVPTQGTLAGTEDFVVRIGFACSGYEGIGLVWIFLCVYLWVLRDRLRFPRAFWLLPLGTAAVWSANVLRIVGLILIGDLWSPSLALGAFHTRMGWVLFCTIALGIVAFVERSSFFLKQAEQPARIANHAIRTTSIKSPVEDPTVGLNAKGKRVASRATSFTAAYLAPLFLVLATQLCVGAFVIDESSAYPVSLAAGALALWHYRHHYAGLARAKAPVHSPAARTAKSAAALWSWPAAAVGVLVFAVWICLDTNPGNPAGVLAGPSATSPLVYACFVLSTTLLTPIAEELAFRGYLMRRFVTSRVAELAIGTYTLASTLLTATLFGAMHDRWFVGTLAGLAYGLLTCRTKRLAPAIQAHAITNALLVIWALV